MDDDGLRTAYAELAAAARSGDFVAPEPGEWTAEQVVAHVIVNDRLLASATADLLDDGEPSFSNDMAQRLSLLDAVVESCETMDGLISEMQRQSRELCGLAQQMDEIIGPRRVTVHLLDHDETVMEGPLPWDSVLKVHAEQHLPSHTAQVLALRDGAPKLT